MIIILKLFQIYLYNNEQRAGLLPEGRFKVQEFKSSMFNLNLQNYGFLEGDV